MYKAFLSSFPNPAVDSLYLVFLLPPTRPSQLVQMVWRSLTPTICKECRATEAYNDIFDKAVPIQFFKKGIQSEEFGATTLLSPQTSHRRACRVRSMLPALHFTICQVLHVAHRIPQSRDLLLYNTYKYAKPLSTE